MSYLIQLLLPLKDNRENPFPEAQFLAVEQELKDQFGGVTTYTRSPAKGQWVSVDSVCVDDIVVYEVMTSHLDPSWWKEYRIQLETRFKQEELVIRALRMEQL